MELQKRVDSDGIEYIACVETTTQTHVQKLDKRILLDQKERQEKELAETIKLLADYAVAEKQKVTIA